LASGIHSQGATPLMAMHIVLFKKKVTKSRAGLECQSLRLVGRVDIAHVKLF